MKCAQTSHVEDDQFLRWSIGPFLHEGPTENRLGELGSLYKYYYYYY